MFLFITNHYSLTMPHYRPAVSLASWKLYNMASRHKFLLTNSYLCYITAVQYRPRNGALKKPKPEYFYCWQLGGNNYNNCKRNT